MTPAGHKTCNEFVPAVVSGINRLRLTHPEVSVKTKWVGCPTVFCEFPISAADIGGFSIQSLDGLSDLPYTYAVRYGKRRVFLDDRAKGGWTGQSFPGNAVLEAWSKDTGETESYCVTIAALTLPIAAYKHCSPSVSDKAAGVRKDIWLQIAPNYGGTPIAEGDPIGHFALEFPCDD